MSRSDEEEFEGFLASKSVGNCVGESFCDDDDDDHGVGSTALEEEAAAERPTWKVLFLARFTFVALLLVSLLLVVGGVSGRSSMALVRGRHRSLDQLRLDIAAASIEMMQEDTVEAASLSQMIDIGPFYDLVNDALDTLGVRGVYMELFESNKFVNAIRDAAKNKGLHGFNASVSFQNIYDKQPYVKYMGIPNDRVYDKNSLGACSGCKWWLNHYVGAITADKLLREGSLLLDGSSNKAERIYGAAAFMHELQRIERLEDSDIMPFHAQHGFVWQYLTAEMPMLDSYPLEVAEAFCGDLLWKDENIEHVNNDMARECRHGFGHGVYMVLAVRETVGVDAYSVRQQFRPSSGFLLSDESLCEAYKICSGAPNTKSLQECKGAMRHSYKVIGVGKTFADGSSVQDFLADQEKQCNLVQQAGVAPTSLQPHQGSFLGPNKKLYADHEPSFIFSPNGQFRFGLDSEGGLSLWNEDSKVWSAGTLSGGDNTYISMQQADGNLVVYTRSHNNDEDGEAKALWSSKTEGHPDATLRIDNDGQARIYAADDKHSVLWETTANVASVKPSSSSTAIQSVSMTNDSADDPSSATQQATVAVTVAPTSPQADQDSLTIKVQSFDNVDYSFADENNAEEFQHPAVPSRWDDERIHRDWHPKERKDRFPSIDERVRLYMSNWYLPPCHLDSSDHYIFQYRPPSDFNSTFVAVDVEDSASNRKVIFVGEPNLFHSFLVDNRAVHNCSQHEYYRLAHCQLYCRDFLHDMEVLYPGGQISPAIPPVITVIGDRRPESLSANYSGPMLMKYRGSASRENIMASTMPRDENCLESRERLQTTPEYQDQLTELKIQSNNPAPIIWKLHTDRHFGSNLDKARNSLIPWSSKINGTIWRGSLNGQWMGRSSSLDDKCDKTPRCKLVMQHIDSNVIDAGLTLTHADELDVWAKENGLTKETLSVEDQLRYKILISMEGNDVSSGLKWMLLSNSVVLMPPPTCTSWAMEELLEPFVHYVPMNHDGSNAEEMVQWIMDNDEKARRIAERATLFMEDMLYHPDAEKDELEIKREIMRRYRAHWMPAKSGPPLESSGSTSGHKSSLDQLRLDIAAVSIEMMQENTVEAASRSQMIDIGPLYDLIDAGLDTFGVRGIYAGLFDVDKFAQAVRIVAEAKGLQDFKAAATVDPTNGQSYIEYKGIPNDRTYYLSHTANVSGGVWWLWHYVGAITADKLLREGSLLLDGSNNNSDRVYSAAAFMRELQRIERLEDSDIMPFHAQHGFIWQYLAAEMPMLDSYPLEVAEAFCGDLLWKDEYIEHVNNDLARECRHGFGHGLYMILAVRETVGFGSYSVRQQFRPGSGFLLSNESLCEAYKICSGAPNSKTHNECKGAMRHSYKYIGVGVTFADGSSVHDFLVDQEKQCNLVQQVAVAPTSSQPHQGSFLGPNKMLYAKHEPSFIFSPNGQFRFGLDSEGDLSLWNKDSKVWSAKTQRGKGDNTYVSMQQADGNLVVYTRSHNNDEDGEAKVLWSSKTEGHPDATLKIDTDGQARIYAADDKHSLLWETTANGASVKPSSSSTAIQSVSMTNDSADDSSSTTQQATISLDQLRLDIAAVSIEMMQENTVEAASRSQMIDIGPLYDLIDAGLDTFGVRGIYAGLFDLDKFAQAVRIVAEAKGLQDFKAAVRVASSNGQSYIEYEGIPNDRTYFQSDTANASGGVWWLWHYVGAITADKLLREGSLLLDGSNNNSDRVYSAAAFMRELQRIERLEDSDIMPFHAQHGFIWQYLAAEMPMLDSYPLEVAEAFCGDLLWKDEYIEHVNNDLARECRHGFGHGLYLILAVRETVGFGSYSVRQQFRPGSGFLLSNESLCEAYKICSGAPNTKTLDECKGAMRHSYKYIGVGETFADGSNVHDFLVNQEKQCNLVQQAAVAPTSSQPHQGSFLGPNKMLYAKHEPSFIFSPNGQFRFGLDSEGDLSLWNKDSKVWSAKTQGKGDNTYVSMQQADGNLVVYTRSHNNDEDGEAKVLWSSKTEGHPDATLRIDTDGQARIYAADDKNGLLWETTANVASVKSSSSSTAIQSVSMTNDSADDPSSTTQQATIAVASPPHHRKLIKTTPLYRN